MRLATWNVNSLKVRIGRVEEWLADVQPDVVCLQETKLSDKAFPAMAFQALGYESAHVGQGQWNGVAILSRVGLENVTDRFADGDDPDPEARLVTATCGGVRVTSVYVPNGRSLDDPHYEYKLAWLRRLSAHVANDCEPTQMAAVCGDFNIAPDDRDVYAPEKFVNATHVSDAERSRLGSLLEWGMVDVFRAKYDDPKLFSWWDYRAGDFHEGRGLRIDLILATKPLAERLDWVVIDRNARKGKQPSDHAPLIADFDL